MENKYYEKWYYKKGSEYHKKRKAKWRLENSEYYLQQNRIYQKVKLKTDIIHKLKQRLRQRIYKAIKLEYKSGSAVKDLGCSIEEFKAYIEQRFRPGMSWENWGEWHLDHIKPLSLFNLQDREELLKACNYTNYQPLWAEENIKKSN